MAKELHKELRRRQLKTLEREVEGAEKWLFLIDSGVNRLRTEMYGSGDNSANLHREVLLSEFEEADRIMAENRSSVDQLKKMLEQLKQLELEKLEEGKTCGGSS